MQNIEKLREKKGFICDMDGVIYHGNNILPGAKEFVNWLEQNNKSYVFLTNSSERSPLELCQKLARMGLNVGQEHFYTSALATANFLKSQCPGGSAYVIGEPGLVNALYQAGFTMNNVNPDYVVVGETRAMNYEMIEHASLLVQRGAKLVGTNPDTTGPSEKGIVPATGSLISPIEISTGKKAYYVGKPNPLMMRIGLRMLGCKREDTAIIGDRMDTDIISGIESEFDTVLVLSGVTQRQDISQYPFVPTYVLNGVGDICDCK
ncbi:MAG: HAD family hydrolase [Ruminococcaceae bacterium]|nr:HAD family hydrolase [Oscillospiraceae bacterium]